MASLKLLLVSVLCSCVLAVPQLPLQAPSAASSSVVSDNAGAQSQPVSIIFDNKQTIVNPGQSLSLDCGVAGEYRYCHWENGRQNAIQVRDIYDGYIEGLSKPQITKGNECGIVIDAVTIEDHGTWTCKVFVIGHTLQGSKNVTVTIRPTNPILEVSRKPLVVTEEDTETIGCAVAAARPRVQIHWFLGDEDITYSSRVENSLTDDMGTYKSISSLTHMFKAWNNKKALRCIVSHYTLDTPIEDYVDVEVKYKPWGKDVRLYDIRLGDVVEAMVNFSSNPEPSAIRWGYGPAYEEILADLPVPGAEGRYSTDKMRLDDGSLSVALRVDGFEEMDAMMSFKITVENAVGARDFIVNLSTDEPPNEPLGSGALAGIVVVVLLVILFLLCAVYMRYNHLYCFAEKQEGKAYIQDPRAEEAGADFHHTIGAHTNEAIKASNDQLNGKLDKPENTVTTFNGNGKATAIDHNDFSTAPTEERINTDV